MHLSLFDLFCLIWACSFACYCGVLSTFSVLEGLLGIVLVLQFFGIVLLNHLLRSAIAWEARSVLLILLLGCLTMLLFMHC